MLELKAISKGFPGVRALQDVSLTFLPGEIHGLMGENGAGKSTAIKIAGGIHVPDTGDVVLNGRRVVFRDCREALAHGVGLVSQELFVIPDASVAENILLERWVTRMPGVIDWHATRAEAVRQMRRVGLDVDPELPVRNLSAAQKQLVQIAKALTARASVLLLDEPTSCLTEHEVTKLYGLLRELRATGVVLVFVSHKLEEVFALCDRVTVLRDGRFVGTRETSKLSPAELVTMMIGRECNDDHLGRLAPDWSQPVLQADHLCRAGKVNDASFTLHRGEILGFYGLIGSGRTELARVIVGEDRIDAGRILVRGEAAKIESVRDSLYRHRIGYVTENRKEEGLFLHDSVRMNLSVAVWPRLRSGLLRAIGVEREEQLARDQIASLRVKTSSAEQAVGTLSGGNQQKVSIGKWLAADCDILIVDEPTVGVDVGAKQQIHQLIWDLAARGGKSLIVISSDLPELVRLANRILVFREQRIVGEVRDIDTAKKTYAQVSAEIAPHFA
ncbi:ABC transporter permease [Opitutaceae bacterium EW11]|nr:ABC transporter permease [Opitutaceae bacterium EW11]